MRPNHMLPPCNNPAIRRALLGALDQRDFLSAAIGTDQNLWHVPTGYFPPTSPMANDRGLQTLVGRRDPDQVRNALKDAGYGGEKVVVILPAGLWRAKVFGEVAADLLRRVGMNVEQQILDTASWARRLVSKKPSDQGGWNLFCTSMQGTDALSPASHFALRGNAEMDRRFSGTSGVIARLLSAWVWIAAVAQVIGPLVGGEVIE